jgi:Ca2+-transporting ATPase
MKEIKIPQHPWSSDIEDIFSDLGSSPSGISSEDANLLIDQYGKNIFRNREKKTALSIFLKQIASPLIFILMGACVVTLALGEYVESVVIVFAILVNAGLGFYREYHAENTIEKLSSFIKERSRVLRDGVEKEIDSQMLVPGDVVKLSYGNRVPADIRLFHINNISIDEAILTGESVAIRKSLDPISPQALTADRKTMAHAGTLVVDGFAEGVVVATGNNTQIGEIAKLVSSTDRADTPIKKGLVKLSWIIFAVVVVIVLGVFILGVSRGQPFFEMLILSVAVAVGAVPEALPIALTVILSIGAERISKYGGITRTLMAAETLGSASLVMTDKTGTLTEANMKIVGVFGLDHILGESDSSNKKQNQILDMALNNIDVLIENPEDPVTRWTFKGRPFEVNIAKTAQEEGLDISRLNEKDLSLMVIPFNSSHKFSVSRAKSGYVVMGAPDILLAKSKITKDQYLKAEEWINSASADGQRLIAICSLKTKSVNVNVEDVDGLVFVGVMAFRDPVRKNVPSAINKIQELGVRVVMITGDMKGTAVSVAKELGWQVERNHILTGHELSELSDDELIKLIPDIKIFARVTPEDKLRVGNLYRKLGEVVAMTGDGVNDSPALKAMDIGVAIGSGSDVAKSAADLVLLDDNFEIITESIQEGRRIFSNIQKTFVYLMSNSLDVVFVIAGSLIAGIALPLTALQIIWVNLFTGSLPALAFAYDSDFDHSSAKKHTMKALFTREVNILTFGIGTASSILLFVLYYLLIKMGVDLSLARSVFFVCFASYILAISFSFRSLRKPLFSYPVFSNKRLNQSILIAIGLICVTMFVPFMRDLFNLSLLPLVWLWFVVGWLVLNVALVEFGKYLFRKYS